MPARLLEIERHCLTRAPRLSSDSGSVGLVAFARVIYGESATHEIAQLGALLPARASDGTVDPLAWFFPTLSMREVGGEAWAAWSQALLSTLLTSFQSAGVGSCRVTAAAVHHASGHGGDVFATSLALIDLQAAYRYLPVDRGAH